MVKFTGSPESDLGVRVFVAVHDARALLRSKTAGKRQQWLRGIQIKSWTKAFTNNSKILVFLWPQKFSTSAIVVTTF